MIKMQVALLSLCTLLGCSPPVPPTPAADCRDDGSAKRAAATGSHEGRLVGGPRSLLRRATISPPAEVRKRQQHSDAGSVLAGGTRIAIAVRQTRRMSN